MRRFTKNNFFVEKNPTIVNFPVKNLKLRDIVPVPTGAFDPNECLSALLSPRTVTCLRDLLQATIAAAVHLEHVTDWSVMHLASCDCVFATP